MSCISQNGGGNLGPKALHPTPQNGGRFAGVVEATGEQFNPRWRKGYGHGLIVTKINHGDK